MDPPLAARTVVVSVVHGPRILQRVLNTIAGRGFAVDDLRYVQSAEDRGLLCIVVQAQLRPRGTDRLCLVIAQLPEVLWARPLVEAVAVADRTSPLRLMRFDVSTRGRDVESVRTEAVITTVVEGRRQLAAGDGGNAVEALVAAFASLLDRVAPGHGLSIEVTDHWSSPAAGGHSFATALGDDGEWHWERLCVARDQVAAVASAVSGVAGDAMAQISR